MRKNSTLNQVNFKYIYTLSFAAQLFGWTGPKSLVGPGSKGSCTGQLDQRFQDRHSILLQGEGGGKHSAVTCLTQCVRDTLGPGKTTLTSENEAIWNFYQDQTISSRRQDSLGLREQSVDLQSESLIFKFKMRQSQKISMLKANNLKGQAIFIGVGAQDL